MRDGVDERQIDRVEAIILSMTPKERREPAVIDGSRRKRIAAGSGTSVQQVNQLLQQYKQMRKMMKQLASGRHARRASRHGTGASAQGHAQARKEVRRRWP